MNEFVKYGNVQCLCGSHKTSIVRDKQMPDGTWQQLIKCEQCKLQKWVPVEWWPGQQPNA